MTKTKIPNDKLKHIPEPKLQEISFSGNMPSPYEKDLRKALAKGRKKK